MAWRRRILGGIDAWLFDEYRDSARDLAVYRIVYAILAALSFWGRAAWTAEVPAEWWSPPAGTAGMFDGPPSAELIWVANFFLTGCLLALGLGLFTPIAAIASALLMIALNSVAYSFGKIDHDIVMVLVPIVLAFSGWGSQRSIDARFGRRPPLRPWCIALLSLIIGMAMATAAWPKLTSGWLRTDASAVHGEVVFFFHSIEWKARLAPLILDYTPTILWEVLDWATIFLEFAFIAACIKKRWFQLVCIVASFFHLGILLALDLPHPYNVLAYSAFFPLANIGRRAFWILPGCAIAALVLCPWHGWQEFVGQVVVICGPACFLLSLRNKS